VAELKAEDIANDDDFLEDDQEPNWLLGAVSHYYYVFKMRYFKPKAETSASAPKMSIIERAKAFKEKLVAPSDDGLDDFDQYQKPQTFKEPEIATAQPMAHAENGFESPQYGENTYNEYAETQEIEQQWAEQPAPAPIEAPQAIDTRTTRSTAIPDFRW